MSLRSLGLVVAVAIAMSSGIQAKADSVDGSQGFSVGTLVPNAGSLNQSIAFSGVTTTASQLGEFDLTNTPVGTSWGSFTIDAFNNAVGDALNVSSAGFGVFTGTITADTGSAPAGPLFFRSIVATGTFTPGTNYPVNQQAPGIAVFSVAITKFGVAGLFSATAELQNRSVVPEPSSLVLAGLGVLGVAYQIRRRRQSCFNKIGAAAFPLETDAIRGFDSQAPCNQLLQGAFISSTRLNVRWLPLAVEPPVRASLAV
ncbi:MAG: PEP-CTERM sorting domain-containing protein [Planctomycetaceae bacterium]|nr:MAG: PEP-CTERM sorting domain-containing protein [Planctomycetaceae bacterium]